MRLEHRAAERGGLKMGQRKLSLGAAGHILRYRLRFYQQISGKRFEEIAKAVAESHRPNSGPRGKITEQRFGQILNGYRRATIDEACAMAWSIGISPQKLYIDESPAADTLIMDKLYKMQTPDLKAELERVELERDGLEARYTQTRTGATSELLTMLEGCSIWIEQLQVEMKLRGLR